MRKRRQVGHVFKNAWSVGRKRLIKPSEIIIQCGSHLRCRQIERAGAANRRDSCNDVSFDRHKSAGKSAGACRFSVACNRRDNDATDGGSKEFLQHCHTPFLRRPAWCRSCPLCSVGARGFASGPVMTTLQGGLFRGFKQIATILSVVIFNANNLDFSSRGQSGQLFC